MSGYSYDKGGSESGSAMVGNVKLQALRDWFG